jgi:hypothetical protein
LVCAPNAAASAEQHFLKSLDWARCQQVLSFELRAATSLARSWKGQGRASKASGVLSDVCGRFTEGFGTADMGAAKEYSLTWQIRLCSAPERQRKFRIDPAFALETNYAKIDNAVCAHSILVAIYGAIYR